MNNQAPKSWKRFILLVMLGMALPFGYRQLSDWMATLVPEYAVQIDKGLGFLCAALVAVFVVIPLMKQFDRPS